jgi:ABC-type antimicrobial peptide transport system permease subunit
MVMRAALLQTAIGLAIGIPISMLCVRFVKSMLFDIARVDTAVMAGAVGVLVAAACVAGLIPARKAASINPVTALRVD